MVGVQAAVQAEFAKRMQREECGPQDSSLADDAARPH